MRRGRDIVLVWSWLGRGTDAKNTSSVMEPERFYIYLKGEITMDKNKIGAFLKNNWYNVIIVGSVVMAEAAVVSIYKRSLKRIEES